MGKASQLDSIWDEEPRAKTVAGRYRRWGVPASIRRVDRRHGVVWEVIRLPAAAQFCAKSSGFQRGAWSFSAKG